MVGIDEGDTSAFDESSLMPIDQFFGSPTSIDEIQLELTNVLERRSEHMTKCVNAAGFGFFSQNPDNREFDARVYGPRTDAIEEDLYGISSGLSSLTAVREPDPVAEANRMGMSELSEEGLAEFNIVAADCNAEAYDLHPDPNFELGISEELAREIAKARNDMQSHPQFVSLWNEWSDCMRGAGYQFANRSELTASLFEEADNVSIELGRVGDEVPPDLLEAVASLEDRELSLATSDVQCARAIELDERFTGVQFQLETEILRVNGDRWTLLRAADD